MTTERKRYSPLSANEAAKRLAALTESERSKIMYLAMGLAQNTGWGADDLLQEAIARILAGTRAIPGDVPVVTALLNAMKSVASGVRKSSEGMIAKGSEDAGDDVADLGEGAQLPRGDQMGVTSEEIKVQALYDKFSAENEVQRVLTALVAGDSREEICTTLKIDHKQFATIRRRIRRAYNQLSE